jgi:MFS family permease
LIGIALRQLSALFAILSSVLVLIAGNGLMNTLVPYRAKLEHFPDQMIGLIGSAFFLGMLAGTIIAPRLIRRAGFIRAFAAFTTASIIAGLIFPIFINPFIWMALRAIVGFCFAGLYAVIEVWVSTTADSTTRGRTYALYQLVTFIGSAVGQQMFTLDDAHSFRLFSVGAVFFALAILPMCFTQSDPPAQPKSLKFQVVWLMKKSPAGAAAAACIGLCNGSFWSLAAVYGVGVGLSAAQIGTFMTVVVAGSALAVWPVGRLSDVFERRKVLLIMVIGAMLSELALVALSASAAALLPLVGFCLGCFMFTQYALAVTHSNDRVGSDYALQVSAGLLFLYCVGAIIGPSLGAALMSQFGPAALFSQAAIAHFALAAFIISRMRDKLPDAPMPRGDASTPPIG